MLRRVRHGALARRQVPGLQRTHLENDGFLRVPALVNCVAAKLGKSTSAAADAGTNSLRPTNENSAGDATLQIEAIQLATNFILHSGLQNPKMLDRSQTPVAFASFGAAWKSDEAMGAVKIRGAC